ncbi:MAG: nicotinamide mononucleotide transporter [Saprospiraceae bacterium]|nr:nicotinamide mononucleotide transporter [Candidatus Brachybacter algidus]
MCSYYEYKLYADAGLNVYYFIMSVIGWVNWTRKNLKHSFFQLVGVI